jgi:phosphatidylglycerophosphatase A
LLLSLVVCFVVGVVASTQTERDLATHDPPCVVVDECWGMWAILVAAPLVSHVPVLAAIAFGLFRAFDIVKPPPLKRLAGLPAGWGIMADDLGAAAYSLLVLRLITAFM